MSFPLVDANWLRVDVEDAEGEMVLVVMAEDKWWTSAVGVVVFDVVSRWPMSARPIG